MEYAQFEVEYRRVYELVVNDRGDTDLAPDIARLHALADRVDDEDDRECQAIGEYEHVLHMLIGALRLTER
jgi:hypothetical protein